MKNEEKILDKLGYLRNDIESLEKEIKSKKIDIPESVKHSIIWGTVLITLALIVLWAISISH